MDEIEVRREFECSVPENKIAFRFAAAKPEHPISLSIEPHGIEVNFDHSEVADLLMNEGGCDFTLWPGLYRGQLGIQIWEQSHDTLLRFLSAKDLESNSPGQSAEWRRGRIEIETISPKRQLRLTSKIDDTRLFKGTVEHIQLDYLYKNTPPCFCLLSISRSTCYAEIRGGDGLTSILNKQGELLFSLDPQTRANSLMLEIDFKKE